MMIRAVVLNVSLARRPASSRRTVLMSARPRLDFTIVIARLERTGSGPGIAIVPVTKWMPGSGSESSP